MFRNIHVQNSDLSNYEAFYLNKNISNGMSRIGINCIQERYLLTKIIFK